MNSPLGLSSDAFAFAFALRFCYLSFVLCFALFSLFAVWFLFLCGCTFYVHKRISLNTKTTCGNSNNNKAKTHAHTHEYINSSRHTPWTGAGGRLQASLYDRQSNGKNRKSTSLDNITVRQRDSQQRERDREREKERERDRKARKAQTKNEHGTHCQPPPQQNGNSHTYMGACVCVCVFVACWLSNDIREAVAIPAVCFLCIVIRPMEAGTYVFLFDDVAGCVPQQAVCHMAAAQVRICSILFGGFVLLANPLPRQHTAAQCKMRERKRTRERERACKVIKYLNGLPWQRLHRRLSNAFVMAH